MVESSDLNGGSKEKKKKNFVLLSLDDDKTKSIANTVSNSKCKLILDFLAENDGTESEIADRLGMPISTVHYNLKQLVKARLIESSSYHLSEKGKEVKHYSLANKYIIIAPKGANKESFLDAVKNIIPVFGLGFLGSFFVYNFFNSFDAGAAAMNSNIMMSRGMVADVAMDSEPMAKGVVESVEVDGASFSYQAVAPNSVFDNSVSIFDLCYEFFYGFEPWQWFLLGFVFAVVSVWLSKWVKRKFFNKKN